MEKSENHAERNTLNKTVLVTGTSGFIGSLHCRKVLGPGHHAFCLDSLFRASCRLAAALTPHTPPASWDVSLGRFAHLETRPGAL